MICVRCKRHTNPAKKTPFSVLIKLKNADFGTLCLIIPEVINRELTPCGAAVWLLPSLKKNFISNTKLDWSFDGYCCEMVFVKKREICRKSPLDFPSDNPERWISVVKTMFKCFLILHLLWKLRGWFLSEGHPNWYFVICVFFKLMIWWIVVCGGIGKENHEFVKKVFQSVKLP